MSSCEIVRRILMSSNYANRTFRAWPILVPKLIKPWRVLF